MTSPPAPVPVLGDISLHAVQFVEHELDAGFVSSRIVGLDGELQQRSGRGSHQIRLRGMLVGSSAKDDLAALQKAAAEGTELTFSADISTALDLQKVVVTRLWTAETAGRPDRFEYDVLIAESPPLPPPAQTSAFGGLDDFGLGDLGLDSGVLDSVSSLADQAGSLGDLANSALGQVASIAGGLLSGLGDLSSPSGALQPLSGAVGSVRSAGEQIASAATSFTQVIG